MKKLILVVLLIVLAGAVGFVVFRKITVKKTIEAPQVKLEDKTEQPAEPYLFANDQDKDGIKDEEEKKLGTSDYEFDTDKDGLSDSSEINKWKTDPTKMDTDGDGFGDGIEVIKGYNPLGPGKLIK